MSDEKGFSLVENLVAMLLLGIVGIVFLIGINVSAKSTIVGSEQTRAESLARSQMEYIQSQPYSTDNPPAYAAIDIPDDYAGYSFATPMAVHIDEDGNTTGSETGLQKITLNVVRNGKTVYSIEGYKANR